MTRSTKGYKIFILVIPGISIDPQSRYEMILFMMNNQTIGRTTQNTDPSTRFTPVTPQSQSGF